MATWASLTDDQKSRVQSYVDSLLRPVVLSFARTMARTSVTSVIPQYLESPTGITSTIASPAADSIAGILATLTAGEVVPILTSGYPLSGPLLGSKVVTYSGALNTLLATYFTAAVQQDYAQIVGSPNLIP